MPDGAHAATKLMPLGQAVGAFVKPGMQLCFASTPSRSNAAILEICRQFRGKSPEFALAATGFHSLAHLLGALRLGRRYSACFFGDNYPTPRSHRLYGQLLAEGYELEHWSLWSYVSALAAGAFGQPYALTRSLAGTSLGAELAARGKLVEVPDPNQPGRTLTLVQAIVPDITFLHAPLADAQGNVAFSPPFGEGFYGALGARAGAIVTVERIVPSEVLLGMPHLRPLPTHRVLAVCEAPFGAHPQPLHVAPRELREHEPGYRDDYAGYRRWRASTEDPALLEALCHEVLDAPDAAPAYRSFVGRSQLEALRPAAPSAAPQRPALSAEQLEPSDDLVLLAGRALARRLLQAGHRSILAGIGQAFSACRLAKLLLGERGEHVELMIETGFAGVDVAGADPFLLSAQNVASAERLTGIDSMLGALCCGGASECIGVIGAAEVDVEGNVNSTSIDGELLVGAGGAPDIAACAREVMVLTRADPRRLVRQVQYCTSRGVNVRTIVTEACVFERSGPGEPWIVQEILASRVECLKDLLHQSGFRFAIPGPPPLAEPPSARELELLSALRFDSATKPRAREAAHG
jgi:acyl CoA:acetate/3-ketoacid CoA transferase beta subunit/acyl CoA:acetate/3-ketoacid CoA transferase alpha subunit